MTTLGDQCTNWLNVGDVVYNAMGSGFCVIVGIEREYFSQVEIDDAVANRRWVGTHIDSAQVNQDVRPVAGDEKYATIVMKKIADSNGTPYNGKQEIRCCARYTVGINKGRLQTLIDNYQKLIDRAVAQEAGLAKMGFVKPQPPPTP